jgi:hypothetical protein
MNKSHQFHAYLQPSTEKQDMLRSFARNAMQTQVMALHRNTSYSGGGLCVAGSACG